jgi:tetratricopeptide (TPR) repeat protein
MQDTFEALWRRARTFENQGDLLSAKAIYEPILQAEPDRLYVRLRMSAIEEQQGNYRGAREHALRSAETVRNARWKDLAVVTKRLLTFDEHSVVRGLILGVDWNDPEILRSSVVLSQHLWLIGEVEQALRMIENALVVAPSSHLLVYSRAHVLRYMGRLDEATAEYERCLDLEPNDAIAHWSLAYHQKSDVPGARIDRIRKTQAALPADSPDQPYLHYALFKEFEDAGDVDQAWSSLQAGARIRRQSIRYDAALEEQGFSALQQLTSGGFLEAPERDLPSGRVPIFIVGMPRSGTTLLERILGNHSQVVAAGELNDFNSALCWESNQFLASFITPQAVARLEGIDYARVGSRYIERTNDKARGGRFLIDKNPMNFINAGFIGKALPQAKIVCLRRGAMDACFSNLKELFSSEA